MCIELRIEDVCLQCLSGRIVTQQTLSLRNTLHMYKENLAFYMTLQAIFHIFEMVRCKVYSPDSKTVNLLFSSVTWLSFLWFLCRRKSVEI